MIQKPKILISFSGGRTSAMMTWWMLFIWKSRDLYEMIVVFANTGKEREETLQFVRQCDRYFGFKTVWVEAVVNPISGKGVTHVIVDFKTASRNGEPFEDAIKKYGIPNQSFPHCTRALKADPIKSYAKSIGWKKYYTAIGIRKDEPQRLNWERAKKEMFIYPLALDNPTIKSDVNLFWSKQPFDLTIASYEGNCDMCWKKAFRKLMTIAADNPKLTEWWKEMQDKYGDYTPPSRTDKSKPPYMFLRNSTSFDEITEDSKLPFERAVDESKDIDKFKQMAFWDMELDSNYGCTESCEVF